MIYLPQADEVPVNFAKFPELIFDLESHQWFWYAQFAAPSQPEQASVVVPCLPSFCYPALWSELGLNRNINV